MTAGAEGDLSVVTDRSRKSFRVRPDRSRKSILVLGLGAALVYAGLNRIESAEVATIRTHPVGSQEYVAQVFVVDDPPFVWIRAERPDRLWLEAIRTHPTLRVRRGGSELVYDATVWNAERERIDALFREKYGALDTVAGWVWRRDAVPIRLERRY